MREHKKLRQKRVGQNLILTHNQIKLTKNFRSFARIWNDPVVVFPLAPQNVRTVFVEKKVFLAPQVYSTLIVASGCLRRSPRNLIELIISAYCCSVNLDLKPRHIKQWCELIGNKEVLTKFNNNLKKLIREVQNGAY